MYMHYTYNGKPTYACASEPAELEWIGVGLRGPAKPCYEYITFFYVEMLKGAFSYVVIFKSKF